MFRLVLASLHVEYGPEAQALGAASVAAALKADALLGPLLKLKLVEGLASEDKPALAERILEGGADWVGLSVYSWNRGSFRELAGLLRSRRPGLILFAGGPEASADPGGVLADLDLDFLVLGEGEGAVVQALSLLAAQPGGRSGPGGAGSPLAAELVDCLVAVPGIALPGRLAEARRAPALEAALLPSPWLSGLLKPAGRAGLVWELSRGCPFRCSYCYESKGEARLRRLPMERIEAELELFVGSSVEQVFVLDPTFNADRERARSLLELFRRRAPALRWKFEIRAELLDRGLARAFAALDCSLQVGLQSARPEVLALVGRQGFEPRAFAQRLRLLDEAGASFGLDLIYGLPGDDLEGFKASLDYALARAPNHLDLFPLAVLPGTELAERAAEFGLVAEPSAPHLLLSSPGFSAENLAKAASLAGAADLFYSRGRAVSWFLAALRPLKRKPSALLEGFSDFLRSAPGKAPEALSPLGIEGLQLEFLEREYRAASLGPQLPALRDLVRLNGAWGRALAEGQSSQLRLNYGAEELFQAAALDLAAFVKRYRPRPGLVRVTPGEDGPRVLPVEGRPRSLS